MQSATFVMLPSVMRPVLMIPLRRQDQAAPLLR
jgi:hypothetical protein